VRSSNRRQVGRCPHQVAIVSIKDDFHALAVQHEIRQHRDTACEIIEADCVSNTGALTWRSDACNSFPPSLTARSGVRVNANQLDVVWLRRFDYPQQLPASLRDKASRDLINNDSQAAMFGLLGTEFSGTWISNPLATVWAENKLIQLRAAIASGLRVPRTLVSQEPRAIRRFCRMLRYQVIVKAVRGSSMRSLYALKVSKEMLAEDGPLRLCPTIYQEYIPGNSHIRAHCFGSRIYSVLIQSEKVDWRANLNIPFTPTRIHATIEQKLQRVLRILGLKMGVFDLKIDESGIPVWLEINQQGQFLFDEGLSGVSLAAPFAKFLREEAIKASVKIQRRGQTKAYVSHWVSSKKIYSV